jgi:hypothetical protein
MGSRAIKGFPAAQKLHGSELLVIVPDLEAPLLLYVTASDHVVSGVLVQEKEEE